MFDICSYYSCVVKIVDVFFFFKQKTAYEMRISDWSSDVCSSDLLDMQIERNGGLDLAWSQRAGGDRHPATFRTGGEEGIADIGMDETDLHSVHFSIFPSHFDQCLQALRLVLELLRHPREVERRVGTESASKCKTRWSTTR